MPVLLTLVLGSWGLRRGGAVWHDEAVTIGVASRDLPDLWRTLEHVDAVHGLYYLLMHGLFGLFGTDVIVLRLPSVLATAAAAAGVAMLGLRLAGPRAGLGAGVVFAVLPGVQQYAQEGRSYALVCALVVWATYALVRAVEHGLRTVEYGRRSPWAVYAALMLTACWMHEFAVLALPAHALFVPRAVRGVWVRAAVCVAVGLTPLVLVSVRQSPQVSWLDATKPDEYAHFALMTGAALAAAWAAGAGRRRARAVREAPLPVLGLGLFLAPTGLLMLLSLARPLYLDRYVLYGTAGFALLLGAAFDRIPRPGPWIVRAGAAVAAVTACTSLVPTALDLRTPASRSDDVTALATALRGTARPGDGVVYLSVKRRAWELAGYRPVAGADLARAHAPVASHSLYGTEVAPAELRARMLARQRIIAVGSPPGAAVEGGSMARVKRETLSRHFELCGERRAGGAVITVYARPSRC